MTEHPERNTLRGLIEALQIMAKYAEKGLDTEFFLEGDYGVLWAQLSINQLPRDSKDGKTLLSLGWFADERYWGKLEDS